MQWKCQNILHNMMVGSDQSVIRAITWRLTWHTKCAKMIYVDYKGDTWCDIPDISMHHMVANMQFHMLIIESRSHWSTSAIKRMPSVIIHKHSNHITTTSIKKIYAKKHIFHDLLCGDLNLIHRSHTAFAYCGPAPRFTCTNFTLKCINSIIAEHLGDRWPRHRDCGHSRWCQPSRCCTLWD